MRPLWRFRVGHVDVVLRKVSPRRLMMKLTTLLPPIMNVGDIIVPLSMFLVLVVLIATRPVHLRQVGHLRLISGES